MRVHLPHRHAVAATRVRARRRAAGLGRFDVIPRRRGRAPLDSTGAPAAWDSETGVWVGVAKKTKPDGVPKPRGRAPLGAEWNYETGEWEGGAKTSAKKKK
jgi:hypothetical protein